MAKCKANPSVCNPSKSQTETKRFNIYEKSSGRYLGHATVTADLNGEELLGENLKFGPPLEEEYFEQDDEVEQKYKIERDLYLSDQEEEEEFPEDDDVTREGGGVLSMPMSKFPKFQDATVSNFLRDNFARFNKRTMKNVLTGNPEQGESRPGEKNNQC